jgi:hypothetical protein
MNNDEMNVVPNTTTPTTTTPTVHHKGNVPQADLTFGILLTSVAAKYSAGGILLNWKSTAEATQLATDYATELKLRVDEANSRVPLTEKLKAEEKKHQKALKFVKFYLAEKFGDDAVMHYPAMGLEKIKGAYSLPRTQNERRATLKSMYESLRAHGLDNEQFGTTYWEDLYQVYDSLLLAAREKDGLISGKVNHKNSLKDDGRKFLNCVIHLIYAQFPDEAKSKLREWGFQKEKY